MDTVFIQQLAVKTTIGVYDWEKKIKQQLLLDIEMSSNITDAASSDNIDDTIDYASVASTITCFIEQNSFELIETVAEKVAAIILDEFAVSQVSITLEKPGAVENAHTVGVRITRHKTS
jgi:dihydroneopterin aldolase